MARPMDLSDSEGRETFMRITAFEHLFSILDGDDRDAAIERARDWLRVLYRDTYDTNSRVMRGVRALADSEEWPEEL
jgi:hypothetical protein